MVFLSGPRQVGKTTIAQRIGTHFPNSIYLNWDITEHTRLIIEGVLAVGKAYGADELKSQKTLIIFDEIHKYTHWKTFIKGFYDHYKNIFQIIVTGSSHLDIYQQRGDSLMGRYFQYHIYPFSVGELIERPLSPDMNEEIFSPRALKEEDFKKLSDFSGFPDPYLAGNKKFHTKWETTKNSQLFKEDVRDLTNIHEVDQMEIFSVLLKNQVGGLLNRSNFAKHLQVSIQTINKWLSALENLYFCFRVYPWSTNVARSLIKEPKIFLYDWSTLDDTGKKCENFIACHLLKAVSYWNDTGLGKYELRYIRDKEKREVDFLIVKNGQPWTLVEVKHSEKFLSKNLEKFQKMLGAHHAFQVVFEMPFVNMDCFSVNYPVVVPAKTFLSQLP
ncbi:MAG: ATP-binding protein [Proteobacteria bacterium]|nr:ATP-binding protein [Pseudomonadota bacterium]